MGKKPIALMMALPVLLGFFAFNTVHAQSNDTSQGGNALKISPVRQDATVQPGTSKTLTVFITNTSDRESTVRGVVNDFEASKDESGTPSILLDENTEAPKHGLKKYVSAIPQLKLKGKETKEVPVTITMPQNAAGGGYFGAIRFMPASSSGDDNQQQVELSGSVASLMLVTVPGDVTEKIELVSFNIRGGDKASTFFTSGKSLKATARFENGGNVQVAPFGKITVKKGSKTVSTVELNNTDPRGTILPDSIRKFEAELKNTSGFGKYTVEGNFGYGTNGQLVTGKTSFYVIPWAYIIGVVVLLAVIAAVIFKFVRSRPKSHAKRK